MTQFPCDFIEYEIQLFGWEYLTKFDREFDKIQNIYVSNTRGSKMLFISNICLLFINKSTWVQTNY